MHSKQVLAAQTMPPSPQPTPYLGGTSKESEEPRAALEEVPLAGRHAREREPCLLKCCPWCLSPLTCPTLGSGLDLDFGTTEDSDLSPPHQVKGSSRLHTRPEARWWHFRRSLGLLSSEGREVQPRPSTCGSETQNWSVYFSDLSFLIC